MGAGKRLISQLEKHAVELGIKTLNAGVSVDALKFFMSIGFELVQVNKNIVCGEIALHNIMKKNIG